MEFAVFRYHQVWAREHLQMFKVGQIIQDLNAIEGTPTEIQILQSRKIQIVKKWETSSVQFNAIAQVK
jgi:hypothetical protein